MFRVRKNAENTMRSSAPVNVYWNMTKSGEICRYCGRLHDPAGRVLDERGKLMDQPARPDVKPMKPCPEALKQQAQIKKPINRMLKSERNVNVKKP